MEGFTLLRLLLITTLVSVLAISTPVTLVADDALGIRHAAARAAANANRTTRARPSAPGGPWEP